MSRYWSPIVHSLSPYVPGEQPKDGKAWIKLNTNESPYGPSPRALEAIRAAADESLRLYPDPNAHDLKAAIADYYQITTDQIFVGNGSDEILAFAFQGLLHQAEPVQFPAISYGFYPVYCRLYEIEPNRVHLGDDFSIDPADYRPPNGGVVLANPNAPTGRALPLSDIRTVLDKNPERVVVIDEAYVDFGAESAAALVGEYPNLLVIQTLSKSRGLAGLRVGFGMGDPALIEALERIKNSFNPYPLDRLAIAGAVAAMKDREHFDTSRRKIMATREWLTEQLQALGFSVIPSAANFVYTTHPTVGAEAIARHLREQSILVRHFQQPPVDNYLRISIGTDEEITALVEALKTLLQ